MKTLQFSALASCPFPRSLARVPRGVQIRHAVALLEKNLISDYHDKTLLLVEQASTKTSFLMIERFLRYTGSQHILLLAPSSGQKVQIIQAWEQALSWEEGRHLSDAFSMTSTLQNVEAAHVCISTVFDIQTQVGLDSKRPFFRAFDVVIVVVPTSPGPAWHQIIDLFATAHIPVIGLSSTLSQETGALFFGQVIDATHSEIMSKKQA